MGLDIADTVGTAIVACPFVVLFVCLGMTSGHDREALRAYNDTRKLNSDIIQDTLPQLAATKAPERLRASMVDAGISKIEVAKNFVISAASCDDVGTLNRMGVALYNQGETYNKTKLITNSQKDNIVKLANELYSVRCISSSSNNNSSSMPYLYQPGMRM